MNNKTLKRVGVGLAALAVAAGLVIGRVIDFPKYTWNTIKNWFNKPKATVTQTVGPLKKASITPIPKAQQTPTKVPIVTVAPTNTPIPTNTLVIQKIRRNLNTMDSEMFIVAAQANYDNFIDAKNYLTKYGYNYEDVINSYTVIEHLHQLDTTRLTSEDIHRHIANARTLVAMIVSSGAYNSLPLRSETFETMQDCLNGNPEAGARFVAICSEYNEPLLDMLAIGELESNLIFNQELYNFNVNIYYPEINEYKTRILNESKALAILIGDADLNGSVELSDVTAIAKFELNNEAYPLKNETAYANADMNDDKDINQLDVSILIETQLGRKK